MDFWQTTHKLSHEIQMDLWQTTHKLSHEIQMNFWQESRKLRHNIPNFRFASDKNTIGQTWHQDNRCLCIWMIRRQFDGVWIPVVFSDVWENIMLFSDEQKAPMVSLPLSWTSGGNSYRAGEYNRTRLLSLTMYRIHSHGRNQIPTDKPLIRFHFLSFDQSRGFGSWMQNREGNPNGPSDGGSKRSCGRSNPAVWLQR